MFPYMLLVCLAAAFMGMLNARGHFFIPAMGATMPQRVMIRVRALARAEIWRWTSKRTQAAGANFRARLRRPCAGVAQRHFNCQRSTATAFRFHWVSPWKMKRCGSSSHG